MTLAVCLSLDLLEYMIPFLLTPLYGDILDITGTIFSYIYFGWIGALTLLELVPGMDIFPIFTLTWVIWYLYKREKRKSKFSSDLEKWR